jgi:hypothetical protein
VAEVTYYVALPFVAADDGIAAGEPTECFNPIAVVMRAEALSRKEGHVGAVAFSRTGDPATGDFSDAKVIRKFGEVTSIIAGDCSLAWVVPGARQMTSGNIGAPPPQKAVALTMGQNWMHRTMREWQSLLWKLDVCPILGPQYSGTW